MAIAHTLLSDSNCNGMDRPVRWVLLKPKAVGLSLITGQLDQEFVGCHPNGCHQPGFGLDPFLDGPGDVRCRTEQSFATASLR